MAENMSNMDIAGKVAMVTGGADGIGKAIVEILLQKKAKGVAIVDVNAEKGREVSDTFEKTYGKQTAIFIQCDVANEEQLRSAFEKTKDHFGQLDIVCNNAGIGNEFKCGDMITLNLTAVIIGTYLAVEFMGTENGGNGGVVVNTTSAAGFVSAPLMPIYAATKHGVVGFTRSVAKEPNVIKNGVRVTTIGPGFVETEMAKHVSGRVRYTEMLEEFQRRSPTLQPVDVAEAITKLIEDTSYNGCACFLSYDKKLNVIDEPNLW